jgi:hypothetical protein
VKRPTEENHLLLKEGRHKLLKEKRKAKRVWQRTFAEQCQDHNFKENPKAAWNMIAKLMDGFQSHHKTFIPKIFKNKAGLEAKNDTKM